MKNDKVFIGLSILFAISTLAFSYLYFNKSTEETSISSELVSDIAVVDSKDNLEIDEMLKELPLEELSIEEIDGLILMREEEKLAHDVYTTLYEVWGQNIFTNISRSEQSHTDSVEVLLEKYQIKDPVTTEDVGVFHNQELQDLYDQLIEQGSESLVNALQVGATVEDLDIYDLETLMDVTDNEDVLTLYQNLLKGSRNHMRSFTRMLQRNGAEYLATYISSEDYFDIINSLSENGVIYDSLDR